MRSALELASVCEAGQTPDRDLELEIWRLNGGTCPPGKVPLAWLHCYTESVNAALDLCDAGEQQEVMHEALARLGRRYALHTSFWPVNVPYGTVLARFVAAAALRRIDARRRASTGEEVDLVHFELPDAYVRLASTWQRADEDTVAKADLDARPMARIWDAIVGQMLRDEVLAQSPGKATDEMVAAGQAAYDRKNDDMWSESPTEEYEAGGGPVGYAWRAMAQARVAAAA